MKKLLRLLLLVPLIGFTQVQIGQDIFGQNTNDQYGHSLGISSDGSIIAASSNRAFSYSGSVKIFENNNNIWTQVGQTITGSGGKSIALSGDGSTIAIGGPGTILQASGGTKIYNYDSSTNTWIQIGQIIQGEGIEYQSGYYVSISDDGTVVAISDFTTVDSGANGNARVFKYDAVNNVWNQMGSNFVGIGGGRKTVKITLSSDGTKAAVGQLSNTSTIDFYIRGTIRVYEFDTVNNTWIQIGQTIDNGAIENNAIGSMVDISDDGSIITTTRKEYSPSSGVQAQYGKVYKNINGVWTEYGQEISMTNSNLRSDGVFVSSDGSIIASDKSIYKYINGTWTQLGQNISGARIGDISSNALTIVASDIYNDTSTNNAGIIKAYDLTTLILSTETFELQNLNIYPNPTQNLINIDVPNSIELQSLTLYDLVGKKLLTTINKNIDISSYNSGMYILEIETNKGVSTQKIIKE